MAKPKPLYLAPLSVRRPDRPKHYSSTGPDRLPRPFGDRRALLYPNLPHKSPLARKAPPLKGHFVGGSVPPPSRHLSVNRGRGALRAPSGNPPSFSRSATGIAASTESMTLRWVPPSAVPPVKALARKAPGGSCAGYLEGIWRG